MNQGETSKIIIIAVVLGLILAGIVWWAQTQNLNAPTTEEQTEEITTEEELIQREIDGLEQVDIDAELGQTLDADLNSL
ncbi:MAG: hypothetical protein KGZ30_03480 [Anaplasmataceae bacterium]|nr:hypothetical protein [Anaplasmataceae bacterium]